MASMHQPESSRHATISTIAHDVIRCLKAFEALFSVSESSAERDANEPVINRLRDQLSRFRLWSGNIGAHRKGRSSLDYRLRDSSHLQQQVSKLLRKLMQNIEEGNHLT
ncbi:hypothetical protein F4780DRAFT_154415 [Xylariomycetidae sp. FL0641]|nr:hypothetical protein F4780DRAFT_154415 [Xylariomycetidae sp. FL0641]